MAGVTFGSVSVRSKVALACYAIEELSNFASLTFVSDQIQSCFAHAFLFSFIPLLINPTFPTLIINHKLPWINTNTAQLILTPC